MPEPDILTLEDVRQSAESCQVRPHGEWAAGWVARLCATVEHYAKAAREWELAESKLIDQRDAMERRVDVIADQLGVTEEWTSGTDRAIAAVEAAATLEAERDRLRALVGGMREAMGQCVAPLKYCRGPFEKLANEIVDMLADQDGQRAAEDAARDREDARQWREMVATTERMVKEWNETDPMTRLAEEEAAEGEELRLLRAWEAAERRTNGPHTEWGFDAALRVRDEARTALDAFRARSKVADRG